MLCKLGPLPDIINKDYLKYYIQSLYLDDINITHISPSFTTHNVKYLSLCNTNIQTIENLPNSLYELQVYGCNISQINGPLIPSLEYVGIGYNKCSDHCLGKTK